MKLLIALCFSLFASVTMACTDFTGNYRNQQNEVYSLQQSGCASVAIIDNEGTNTIIADGQFRLTEETDEVRILTAASFVGANFTLDHRIEYKMPLPPEVPTEAIPVKMIVIYVKDTAGNIIETTTLYNSLERVLATMTSRHQKI